MEDNVTQLYFVSLYVWHGLPLNKNLTHTCVLYGSNNNHTGAHTVTHQKKCYIYTEISDCKYILSLFQNKVYIHSFPAVGLGVLLYFYSRFVPKEPFWTYMEILLWGEDESQIDRHEVVTKSRRVGLFGTLSHYACVAGTTYVLSCM